MTQREWVERDYYADLGVSSTASQDEIKKAYRKLARENHPDANPGNAAAEAKFKRISEANSVLADAAKRKEYDQARAMFAAGGGGGFGGGGFRPGQGRGGGFTAPDFDLGDIFGAARGGSAPGGVDDLFGGLFNRGTRKPKPHRGSDIETETTLDFREAAKGSVVQLQLTSPSPCTVCHGSGARPGTSPKVCPTCNGQGVTSRSQGHFAFSEPCADCRGTGSIVESPCVDCGGSGVTTRTRTISVRVPVGVKDGQRIRLAGQGQAGMRGAPSGDLYVTVHVEPDPVFERDGDNLTISVPVSFDELALGTTVSVPTLDGRVGVKVPAGTSTGRTLRVRGKGVPRRGGGAGDLLVTLTITVPETLGEEAAAALRAYAEAERAAGFDPRAGWAGV